MWMNKMDSFEISYAISKQVPSIKERAHFDTNYGRLEFHGKDAERIAAVVRNILEEKQNAGEREE